MNPSSPTPFYLRWIGLITLLINGWLPLFAAPADTWVIDYAWYYKISNTWTSLEEYTELAYDPEEQISFEQIRKGEVPMHSLDSRPFPNLWKGQIWARLRISNELPTIAAWTFLMHVDEAEIYARQVDGSWEKRLLGSNRPRSQWDASQHRPLFSSPYIAQMELAPGLTQEVIIRLSRRSIHPWFELKAMPRPNFLSESYAMFAENNWAQGIFHGMCGMMFFFSLVIFLLKKDRTYLYLSLYILCVSVYLFFQMELDKTWSIAEFPRLSRVLTNAALNGIVVFYSLLVSEFLHRDGWRPDIKRVIRYYFYAAAFGGLLTTTLLAILPLETYNMTTNVWLLFPLPFMGLLGLIYICYHYLRSDNMLARIFAVTNLCLFFGSIAFYYWSYTGMIAQRAIETYLWPIWIMQGGFVLQMIALVLSIAYRDQQVEKEKVRLAEMDHIKSRFFANISHEFRTPLTLILGPIREMKNRNRDPWLEGQLQILQQNARRLLKLINQILDLAKLDSGKAQLHLHTTNLVTLARALTYSFQSLAEQQEIQLTFKSPSDDISLALDVEKMEQVILNLLSNALKYTPRGGRISVSLEERNRWVHLAISNTGHGIPTEQLPHLFERFYQANQTGYTTDQPSTGIGLALSKEWIQLHGGEIEVMSRPHEITRFTVRLPKRMDAPKGADVRPKETDVMPEPVVVASPEHGFLPPEEGRPELLIIEDNPDIRAYIRSCLGNQYQLAEAFDGKAGLEQATASIPDLILTDVMMPKMDGFELCRQLKQQEATSHIPIIILTGKASRDSKLEGLSTQADDFLAKPFDAEELRLRIHNLLRNRALWRKRFEQDNPLAPSPINVPSREQAFLQQAREIIEAHIDDEAFSVEQLSSRLALDRTQLFRKLRALTGQNPSRFIRTIRLKRAHQLLEADAGTASEIAFMVGFSSASYFSKCFKEEFGVTPGEVSRSEE
jgi:signal transduction histidine kinase/DNA-binding response OmpR family regulator